MTIAMPDHHARDYLRAFGVAAIYVASEPAWRPTLVGVTRDVRATSEQVHRAGFNLIAIYWLGERKLGERIIRVLAFDNGIIDATADYVCTLIERTASKCKITLTPHDRTLARVEHATKHLNDSMNSANKRGDLQWFNRAYRQHRIEHPNETVGYQQARSRLRHVMVERIASDAPLMVRTELLGELFTRR